MISAYSQSQLVIRNPDTSAAAIAAGAVAYRSNCAVCHGPEGGGDKGPPLVGRLLSHGGSDWAIYRAISHGVAGTGMQGFPQLPVQDRWRIVAYVKSLGAKVSLSTAPLPAALANLRSVTSDELVSARRDSANWLTYSGGYDGWRYSTLSQIDRGNVGRLKLLWMYQIIGGPQQRFETTPLVVDGVMFITTPRTGCGRSTPSRGSCSGRTTGSSPMSCCSAAEGQSRPGDPGADALPGHAGRAPGGARRAGPAWCAGTWRCRTGKGYSLTSAPLVVQDLVVIGSAGGEYATRGFLDGYDAETGQRRWRFYTIPEPGAPGSDTWTGDSWKTGGGPPWLTGSYDPGRGLLYWGVGNPNPDFNGNDRLGDNLYSTAWWRWTLRRGRCAGTSSLLRTTSMTGTRPRSRCCWTDAGTEPGALLIWGNRNAFYYVLNRVTGKFQRAREFAYQSGPRESIPPAGRLSGRERRRAGREPGRHRRQWRHQLVVTQLQSPDPDLLSTDFRARRALLLPGRGSEGEKRPPGRGPSPGAGGTAVEWRFGPSTPGPESGAGNMKCSATSERISNT